MKTAFRFFLCATLLAATTAVRAERVFGQAELDSLLAPIALYPDVLLSNVLVAARYPDDVREAAAWSRNNPQMKGDDAVRAADPEVWHPSVKALVAFPDLLARMDGNPAWLRDLGEAYRTQGALVMDTVQALRRRAQETGHLRSDERQRVYSDGGNVVVAPASPQVVYVPWYDPYVVYGPWWWPVYRPAVWAPWPVYGVFISFGHVRTAYPDWQRRVVIVNRPVVVSQPVVVNRPAPQRAAYVHHEGTHAPFRPANEPRRSNGPPPPSVKEQPRHSGERQGDRMPPAQGFHRAPESQRPAVAQSNGRFQGSQGQRGPQGQQGQRGFQGQQGHQGNRGGRHG